MGLKINVMMLTCWEKAATQTYYCGPNHSDYKPERNNYSESGEIC